MSSLLDALHADLDAESDELFAVLEPLDEATWSTVTASEPWTIKDQVSHLAWNDEATVFALTDPAAFLDAKPDTLDGIQQMVDRVIVDNHDRSGADLLAWFRRARAELLDAVAGRDPKMRMPWYGPEMSLASKLTARFMETWAHGLDITDALCVERTPTDRVRHVVFLGLQALPNSFVTHARPVPQRPVRLEVRAPSGGLWQFGRPEAVDVVRGDAHELALVVTQRRALSDTGLVAEGDVAKEWLSIAQAFAGPPGAGRKPGS